MVDPRVPTVKTEDVGAVELKASVKDEDALVVCKIKASPDARSFSYTIQFAAAPDLLLTIIISGTTPKL